MSHSVNSHLTCLPPATSARPVRKLGYRATDPAAYSDEAPCNSALVAILPSSR